MRFQRLLAAAFLASSVAIVLVACGDNPDDYPHHSGDAQAAYCARFSSSCGKCTPVLGCGWCSYDDGTGNCTSSASRCHGSEFRWNWEPEGCSTPVDGGPPRDAGKDAVSSDTGKPGDAADTSPSDAPTDAPSDGDTGVDPSDGEPTDAPVTCSAPTTGTNGCVETSGGTLCTAKEYTLGCHTVDSKTPAPDASLGCRSVLTGTPGSSYYCCPCR